MRLTGRSFTNTFCLVIICLTLLSGHVQTQTNDPNGIHSTLVPTLPPGEYFIGRSTFRIHTGLILFPGCSSTHSRRQWACT
jgi:hypothetical protein